MNSVKIRIIRNDDETTVFFGADVPGMRPDCVARELAKRLLPDVALTWRDLLEQVALEHGVPATALVIDQQSLKVKRALQHFCGCLVGAGFGYAEIALALNLDPSRVRNGVRLFSRREGIEFPEFIPGSKALQKRGEPS